jgi:enoyl-CoA hydratase/carnithine racemase
MSTPPDDLVTVDYDAEVAIVTMNEPKRRNPFSVGMRLALSETFRFLFEEDDRCRTIVLTGAGGHFCAGGDISGMASNPPFLQQRQVIAIASELVRTISTGRKPVLAAVEGSCIGAGLSLACAADVAIAGATSKLGCTFVKMGLLPDTGLLWTLVQRAGAAKARELMLSARTFGVPEALAMGVLDQQVPQGDALKVAIATAHDIDRAPPVMRALLRAAMVNGMNMFQDCCRLEAQLGAVTRSIQPSGRGAS